MGDVFVRLDDRGYPSGVGQDVVDGGLAGLDHGVAKRPRQRDVQQSPVVDVADLPTVDPELPVAEAVGAGLDALPGRDGLEKPVATFANPAAGHRESPG